MNALGLLQNNRFRLAVQIGAGLILGLVLISLVVAELLPPTPFVSDVGVVICSVIAAVLFVSAWRRMDEREVAKRVWGLVALGIVLWAVAEFTWAFYELVLGIEIPYPSVADVFWLGGYVPFYAALIIRYRSFASGTRPAQAGIVGAFALVYSVLLIVFVAMPLIESFDPTRLVESIINAAYPLADWGLCILTLVIIFSLEGGRFARVWHLLGLGLLLMATADLVFFYADWNGFYYPDGRLNFISALLDTLYNVSYLMMGLSIIAYTQVTRSISGGTIQIVFREPARMKVLIFVGAQGRILSLSDNFMNLVRAPSTKPYINMDIEKALGLDGQATRELLAKIARRETLRNHPTLVTDTRGEKKSTYITSLIMLNEEGQYDLLALLISADPPPPGEIEYPLLQDQKLLIDHYLEKSGASVVEESRVLRSYFLAQVNLLHSVVQQFSGNRMADNLLQHLGEVARARNWPFSRVGQDISLPEELEGQALANLLSDLLEEVRRCAADMADQRMIEQEMRSLDRSLPKDTLAVLDKYGLQASAAVAVRAALAGPLAG